MDGTEDQKDTSQIGDSSEGKQGTSEKDAKTFTSEQVAEISKKAASDALSAAGRTAAAFEKREAANKAAEDRTAQAQKDKDAAELEAARGDTDAESSVKTKHALREAKAKLASTERELNDEREKGKQRDAEATQSTLEVDTFAVATRLDKDPVALLKLVKFTDGSKEAIEAMAEGLPKKGEIKPPILSDSGRTIRGVGDLSDLSPVERKKERERRLRGE